jgi:hypothetical protein
MAQYNPLEIRYMGEGKYYSYDDELYHNSFPEEWAMNHVAGTGPKECGNCKYVGHWNGVFIGYCGNCAKYVYLGERGCGFIELGKELYKHNDCVSAFETYLKDVNLDDIGDTDFFDSAKVVEEQEYQIFLQKYDADEREREEEEYFEKLQKESEIAENTLCQCYEMCDGCSDREQWNDYLRLRKEQEDEEEEMDDEQRIEWYIDKMSEKYSEW